MTPKRLAVLLLVLAPGAAQALHAQTFEGVVHQRVVEVRLDELSDRGLDTSEALFDVPIEKILERLQGTGAFTVTQEEIVLRGPLMRMDASDEEMSGWVIIDTRDGVVRMMNPDEGMYMEMTEADLQQMASFGSGFDEEAPEITETGQTKTINGMHATAFDVVSYEGTERVWVTRDDPELTESFLALARRATAMSMGDAPDPSMLVAENGIPVLMQSLDYDVYRVSEVVTVERRSVAAHLFDPPAGLRRMTMQDMMGGGMPSSAGRPSSPPDAGGGALSGLLGGGARSASTSGEPEPSGLGALAGLFGGGATVWIEYEVSGSMEATGREEDVVMCSETDSGFQSRSLGDVVIGIEADGNGEGSHRAELSVAGPDGRYEGAGRIEVREVGTDPLGLTIVEVEFEGAGLEARSGGTVNVRGSLSCAAM